MRTLFKYSEFTQYKGLPPIRFRRKHTDEEFLLLYDINTSKEPWLSLLEVQIVRFR